VTRQEMQNTFAFIIEQQAKFEDNFTRAESRYGEVDKGFLRAEKRLDRLEKLAERLMRAADERMKRLEARTVVLQDIMIDLARSQKSVLEALRRYSGNATLRGFVAEDLDPAPARLD
jgi:hypothetical protein